MTTLTTSLEVPAALGGAPAFPDGLALTVPTLPDRRTLERELGAVLESGQLTNGRRVAMLEEQVADRLGVRAVVAVSSCTSGLALTYQALGVRGPVVIPSFTFSASAHGVVWAGAEPRFADIAADTLCLDPAAAAAATDGAGAISATHIYGTPCRVEELEEIAAAARIPLVLDAAHALGSERRGRPVGGHGAAEVFSLSPTKVVFGGEGGLVSTDDTALAENLRLARNYGNPGDYDCRFVGLNARMSELHAAVALHSFRWLDEHVQRRTDLADRFWQALAGIAGLTRPLVEPGDVSTYKDLTLVVEAESFGLTSEQLAAALALEGVDTRHYYRPPVHAQTAYRPAAHGRLPVTDRMAAAVVSVPLWSHMVPGQVATLAGAIVRIGLNAERVRARLSSREVTR